VTDRRTDRRTPRDGIGRAYAQHRAAKISKLDLIYRMPKTIRISLDFLNMCPVKHSGLSFCATLHIRPECSGMQTRRFGDFI